MTATERDQRPDEDAWPIGPDVDPDLLALRGGLPRKPAPVVLTGPQVLLRPLELPGDAVPLHRASNGAPYDLFVDGPYDPPSEKLTGLELNGWGYRWIRLARSDQG